MNERLVIQLSEVESEKFSLPVFRADLRPQGIGTDEWARLVSILRKSAPALAIVKTGLPNGFDSLRTEGVEVRIADAQVLFRIDSEQASQLQPSHRADTRFSYTESTLPSAAFLEALRATFENYPLHYAASPELPKMEAPDVYEDWAFRVASDSRSRFCGNLIDSEIASLALVTLDSRQEALSILLAGTVPTHRNAGAYTTLLREIIGRAPSLGARAVSIATRVDNVAVINAWKKVGMQMYAGTYTLHVWAHVV